MFCIFSSLKDKNTKIVVTMIFLSFVGVLVLTVLVKYWLYIRRLESNVKHLPTVDHAYPFIGNISFLFGKNSAQLFKSIVQTVKDRDTPLKSWIGPVLNITLDRPEDVKTVLMSPNCFDKPILYSFIPIPTGLLNISSGALWKPLRKLLNPTFNLRILQSFVPIFNDKTKLLLQNLDKEVGNTNFNIADYMFACTLDMVCATTMGYNVDVQQSHCTDFIKGFQGFCEIIGKRLTTPWAHPSFIYRWTNLYKAQTKHWTNIDNLVNQILSIKKDEYLAKKQVIIAEKAIFENSDEQYRSPQVLINELLTLHFSHQLSEPMVKDQIATALIGGSETSSLTSAYAILMLAMQPEMQERLFVELRSVFETADEYVSYEHIQHLSYLDCVLKETLRLFPVTPFILRYAVADVALEGCTIPKDATISISLFNLHRRPEIWDDAEEFKPDRFLPEFSNKRHPFSFLPFSGGPRNCIGIQYSLISLKVILAGILRKYKFNTNLKLADLEIKVDFTTKLANKHMVSIERRAWC